jgi:hypothetical protein
VKAGDLVRIGEVNWCSDPRALGIVVKIDDSHRQRKVDVMFSDSYLLTDIWVGHLEVISESR